MRVSAVLFGIIASLLISVGARAAEEGKEVQLFNGKDFTGWVWVAGDKKTPIEDVWSVKEDGIVHCIGKPAGYIRTEATYTNYVLKLEWRAKKPGNGGVLIRRVGEDKVWPKSVECQLATGAAGDIWNIDKFPMKVAQDRTTDRHTKAQRPANEKPLGEWNQYEIIMDGGDLTMKVNGEVMNTASEVEVVAGNICLQSEGAEMEYRNFTLTPIAEKKKEEAKAPEATKEEKKEEAKAPAVPAVLQGWHQIGAGTWTMQDGVIIGKHAASEKEYGHLISEASYQNFKVSFKFKCLAGNSGFYFRCKQKDLGILGMQAEIDAAKDVGGVYESGGKGWVVHPKPEDVAKWFKPNEWNEMTVGAEGPHIVVKINGQTSAEISDAKVTQGPFALQMHGGIDVHVEFKDLSISGTPLSDQAQAAAAIDPATMEGKAAALFTSLSDEQKKTAALPYDSPDRNQQLFPGGKRAGIQIKDLNDKQREMAIGLLTAFTSDYGKAKCEATAAQGEPGGIGKYYVAFFGEPGKGKSYAWRIAEHHLTLVHVEVEKGQAMAFGPILQGANPPTLWDEEEDALIALYAAMTPAERTKAHKDGIGMSSAPIGNIGVPVAELSAAAVGKIQEMLDGRLKFFAPEVAERIRQILQARGGLAATRIAFYGDPAEKRCRDGAKWDFKLGTPAGFVCDYENSRGHIHLSMKASAPAADETAAKK